jgi:acyl-coenzyme A thioesterase PaaI-like protein
VKDWSALEEAAAAMRRLNRAVANFEADDGDWREVAARVTELAERLETGDVRSKDEAVLTLPDFVTANEGRPLPVAVGEAVEFDPFSIGSGRLHPSSVGMELRRDGDASVSGVVHVDPMFQGPPGRVHGGVVALLMDELMSMVNRIVGRRAYTARLAVDLRAPAPIGTDLTFRARLHDVTGRKITIRADGRSPAGVFAEAEALFVAPAVWPADGASAAQPVSAYDVIDREP